ncbi:hypothetical protein [Chitinilyticum litopenaei]|uniref:hypothetical protein n=1 Tax=Chitinilyticum litopenaei TaxID=1121276 RepID=UPI0003FDB87A|nr:hypothetical protein [Chitinilyticum litopenaei]
MLNWISELAAWLIPEPNAAPQPRDDLFSHGWQYQQPQWWQDAPAEGDDAASRETPGLH